MKHAVLFLSKQLNRIAFAALAGLLVNPVSHAQTEAVGLSQGKLSAQPSGGLAYEMPIVVSPGTSGMQPKLSFQYSSGGRNGPLGVGWSIGGISAITRAPQTRAQDGTIHGVDLTLNDRYAMDGQRLIAISGPDGGDGTEYRTEINSFTKVISNGHIGGGPATFTARTKSGLIYTFGGPNGASYVPAGQRDGTVLTWLLSKVEDQTGNYMTFSYTREGNLTQVDYTMNGAATSGYASVLFEYSNPRPDPIIGYVTGHHVAMHERLNRVTSYFKSTLVRQYDLSYGIAVPDVSANTKKSRLQSIRESAVGDSGLVSYPPTTFAWDNDPNSVGVTSLLTMTEPTANAHHWVQGDFNGDGLVDLAKAVKLEDESQGSKITVFRVLPNQLVPMGETTFVNQRFHQADTWLQGDFTGDGKLDLVRVHENDDKLTFTLFRNDGTDNGQVRFATPPVITNTSGGFSERNIYMAMDVNGDGKLDIIRINGFKVDGDGEPHPRETKINVYVNNGNETFTSQVAFCNHNCPDDDTEALDENDPDNCKFTDRWLAGDLNGDGLPDLIKIFKDGNNLQSVRVYILQLSPTGQITYAPANWREHQDGRIFKCDTEPTRDNQYKVHFAYRWLLGDFNGDGLADLVRVPLANNCDANATTADVYFSTGIGFEVSPGWASLSVHKKDVLQCGDFNGDARSDLLVITQQTGGQPDDNGQGEDVLGPTNDGEGPDTPDVTEPDASYSWSRYEYFSNGTSAFWGPIVAERELTANSSSSPNHKRRYAADFNGDGKEDLLRSFRTNDGNTRYLQSYMSNPGFQDLLRSVTDGMGVTTTIEYKPLTDPSVFTKSNDALAPAIDIIVPMPVVSTITYDNGLGAPGNGSTLSTYSIRYHYYGLKADPLRGMLGFESVEAIDMRTVDSSFSPPGSPEKEEPNSSVRLHTRTWFNQGFPFNGMARRVATYVGTESQSDPPGSGPLLSESTTTYALGPVETQATETNVPTVYFPYAQYSRVRTWDLNGVPTNDTETIVESIDQYGNTMSSVVKTRNLPSPEYFTKTTQSEYDVDTTRWRIGQVRNGIVIHEAPGCDKIVRTSGFGYDRETGQVSYESIENYREDGAFAEYEYDQFGNTHVSRMLGLDVNPRVTQTDYDEQHRFVRTTTNALGHTETKFYDERFGAVASVIGPNGLTDTAEYDGFGRLKLSTRADGTRTITRYEWVGGNSNVNLPPSAVAKYLVRVTPQDGPETVTYFDRLGREVRKQTLDAKNRPVFVDMTYDYRGRKKTVTRPFFKAETAITATTIYDALNRVREVQVPSVNENGDIVLTRTTTSYDGLATTVTNPKGQSTTTIKDGAGHVVQVQDALHATITYSYDAVGQLIQTLDAAGNATTITYDRRGRKTSLNDPDLGLWTYEYYATGELKSQTDAKGQTVSLEYDELGRMTRRHEPVGDLTVWTYDSAPGRGIGKLASVEFTPGTLPFGVGLYSNRIEYDDLGRVSIQQTHIHGKDYETRTEYDQFSRPRVLTYPSNFQIEQVYGTNGHLTAIRAPDGTDMTYWSAGDYDAEGHVTEEVYGNGVITDRVYLPQNGLLREIHSYARASTDPTVQRLDYRFDVLGNLKKRADGRQNITETFDYDDLNRLVQWQVAGQSAKTVSYDQINGGTASLGNIANKDGADYKYDPQHPHAVGSIDGGPTAKYDENGNMTSGFGRALTWTWFNMPQRIERAGAFGGVSTFEYDADHNRVWQEAVTNNGSITSLVDTTYVGGFYESVTDGVTIKAKHYINSPVGRVAIFTLTKDIHTQVVTPDTKYLHRDHLGSVDVVTSESGAVLERDSFDAWGARRATDWQGPPKENFQSIVTRGFTDHEQLDHLGLVHMNGRVYDPLIGRFLSADPTLQFPFQTQNFNRYSYVMNNPLSFTDPSGFSIFGSILNFFGGFVIGNLIDWVSGNITTTQFFNAIITGIASFVAAVTLATIPVVGPFVSAFGAGFTAGFVSTLLAGGSLGQAFQSGAIGGGIALATYGILRYGLPTFANALNPHATVANTGAEAQLNGNINYTMGSIDSIPEEFASDASVANPTNSIPEAQHVIVLGNEVEHFKLPQFEIPPSIYGPLSTLLGEPHFDELAARLPRYRAQMEILKYTVRQMDALAPKVGDKELAINIDASGRITYGPEYARSRTGSDPATITSDTRVIGHYHLTGPDVNPYKFSDYGYRGDEVFMRGHQDLIHVVGVLDAEPGKFSVFYRAPGQPFGIYRPTPEFYKYLNSLYGR